MNEPAAAPFDPQPSAVAYGRIADWRAPCKAAARLPRADETAARRFFEHDFVPFAVADFGRHRGLFTGYFEIALAGSLRRHGPYRIPLYRRPPDARLATQFTRAQIDDGALAGRHLAFVWVKDAIAAYFLQVEGSGIVRLDNGKTMRVGYAGQNGKPYVPIGRTLLEDGAIARGKLTMQTLIAWMRRHPRQGARLRRSDPSYVYFRRLKGPGPIGAEGVVLTGRRSLAVDRRYIPLGAPIWLEARQRFAPRAPIRRLLIAQDVGGAIRGPVRGDIYWGSGTKAGAEAGATNARGRYFVLLPRAVAARLGATS